MSWVDCKDELPQKGYWVRAEVVFVENDGSLVYPYIREFCWTGFTFRAGRVCVSPTGRLMRVTKWKYIKTPD